VSEKIKIEHYVPRFYLRNFATQKGATYFAYCFDKTNQKVFPTNIDTIAAEKYFYDEENDTNQTVERKLGKMETTFSRAYVDLLKQEDITNLSGSERKSLAYFIILQELRTREFREMIGDMITQLGERLSRERLSENFKNEVERVSKKGYPKEFQLDFIAENLPGLGDILNNMKWVLLVNGTANPYWTSDHPVNRNNPIDLAPYGNLGLRSPGIEIYFPLSTRLALMICDPSGPGHLFPNKFNVTNEQNVIFQNHLQVKTSTRHILSPNKDFSLAQRMLKEHPEIGITHRQRMRVQ